MTNHSSIADNNKLTIHLICAARPNFMKIAPLYKEFSRHHWIQPVLVHTGQHYDTTMSDTFFRDLGLPAPDIHLNVGSANHGEQTALVLMRYEKILIENRPDLVIVVGDVNSTMAATIAAVKLGIKVAHLEAGLRSFDRTMPEELNRLVTDTLADILWTPSPDGDENLRAEGISPEKIHRVGNIMIDSLEMMRTSIEQLEVYREFSVTPQNYALVTLHRPSNVDNPEILIQICRLLERLSIKLPLIFPLHPRTKKNLEHFALLQSLSESTNLHLSEPISYNRFMNLVFNCKFVLTDSGGIQEETTYLNIPCLTLRPNTERPVTITQGTNQLCTLDTIEHTTEQILAGKFKKANKIEFWDGNTARRITDNISLFFQRP